VALYAHAVRGLQRGIWLLDAWTMQLTPLDGAADMSRVAAALRMEELPPLTLFTCASADRTLTRYPEGSTLVWRDAGVLLGYLHLAAFAMGLASCIVGTAGVLGAIPQLPGAVDIGAVAVGAREREGNAGTTPD
jgi:hypothetical protein